MSDKDRSPQSKDSSQRHKTSSTPPKVNFRGITLKEYFRLCEEQNNMQPMQQIQQQSHCSSKSSLAQTPTFQIDSKKPQRPKMKTQFNQQENQNFHKNNIIKNVPLVQQFSYPFKLSSTIIDKGNILNHQLRGYPPFKKKQDKKRHVKRLISQPSKNLTQINNRSTLASFYQLDSKKNKMLKKIKGQKQRINDLKLNDMCYITKYGTKFQLDKHLVK